MTLDDKQTQEALDHLDKTTAVMEALLPVLRNTAEAGSELSMSVELVSRNARAWLNAQRVRQSMEQLRASQEPRQTPPPQPERHAQAEIPKSAESSRPAPEPGVNQLDVLGDLLKSIAPLADTLAKLVGPRR